MAVVAPFRALRFNPLKLEHLEDVVTPPYDIIDEKKQASFQARNPYNMIYLDISKSPGKGDDSEERYNSARNYFTRWQEDDVLIRDNEPAIYLYNIDYTLPSGIRLTRKGLVALVELSEFSEGIVKPHEETFSTVTADRLRLMDACQAQFSQVFSLYAENGSNIIALKRGRRISPFMRLRMRMVVNIQSGRLRMKKFLPGSRSFFVTRRSILPTDITAIQQHYSTGTGCGKNWEDFRMGARIISS